MSEAFLCSEIIRKKRDGKKLSSAEIFFVVKGAASGSVPDYQLSAWLMAAFLKGLDVQETLALTEHMKNSGETLEWRKLSTNFKNNVFVDKHSTGGVGDKVSLVLAPLVACFGLKVPMMSGRGLGFTGGTVDKLECIPGFNMYPERKKMIEVLDQVGACMMAQAPALVPADRKFYALRDVTATVENVSLITASIVSKKWAEGVDAIVFDVKCGQGAFMTDLSDARALAQSLVSVASSAGLKAKACLTRMNEPLGAFVGNTLEVLEALSLLKNVYPTPVHAHLAEPLKKLCVSLAAEMALLTGTRDKLETAEQNALEFLESGQALKLFYQMCKLQGAESGWEEALEKPTQIVDILAKEKGCVQSISGRTLGLLGLELGMGRKKMEDTIDPSAGFELLKGVGDDVELGEPLLRVHLGKFQLDDRMKEQLLSAYVTSPIKRATVSDYRIEGM